MIYSHDRNTVEEIPFEFAKSMPETLPSLYQLFDSTVLRRLIDNHPTSSLQELCDCVKREQGIIFSPQTMCKLLLRADLPRNIRRQIATSSRQPLAALPKKSSSGPVERR